MKTITSQRLLNQITAMLYPLAKRSQRPKQIKQLPQIVHVSPSYFSEASLIGGGERYVTDLALATAKHLDTTLVTFGHKRQSLRRDKLKIEVYPALDWIGGLQYDPLCYIFLKELVRADIIHCHQYRVAVTNLAMLAGAVLGKHIFVTDYGGAGKHFTEVMPIADLVDGFLPISAFSSKMLPSVRQKQILYGGVPEKFLNEPGVAQPGDYVLFVGRLLPHKGINYLIEAIDDTMCLELVGHPYHENYFKLLQQLAGGKKVRFNTRASDDQLCLAYQGALVTVLPSVYEDVYGTRYDMPELLGLVLLESMASGVPVICTAVGSMPEIVIDGITGFVVPPNNPAALHERITYLYQNPQIARQMGQAGRQKVQEIYTWDAVAARCLAAYREE